jgi:hypothetical protein
VNQPRISLGAVEAAEDAEDRYRRAMAAGAARQGGPNDLALRRLLRRSVQRAVTTDAAVVGAVRMLPRNKELASERMPEEAA